MDPELSFESELIERIEWLIRLRWVAVLGTALAVGGAAVWFGGEVQTVALLCVTAVIVLYNTLLHLNLRTLRAAPSGVVQVRQATMLAQVQIGLDLLCLALLIHFSGGVENPMWLFFVFHVIIASILLRRPVSYLMTALAAGLLVAVVGLEYFGLLPHHHLPFADAELFRDGPYVALVLVSMAVTLAIVAGLTTSISSRLRQRDQDLYRSRASWQTRSEELAQLNEELGGMDKERTRLLMLVTHELRAPLGTIYSALELVLRGYTNPEETRSMLLRARIRAAELLDLIGDLLNLNRLRGQAVPRESAAPISLADVLRDVIDSVQADAMHLDVTLEVDVEPDLVPVRASAEQMAMVWKNLLSNAIKYNRPGGRVHVSLRQDGQHVSGQVRDTGIGVASQDLPHLFEEFFRADNAKQVSPHGTGVGLALVRQIVENWGGRVWAESELGRGTTFTFELPRADVEP